MAEYLQTQQQEIRRFVVYVHAHTPSPELPLPGGLHTAVRSVNFQCRQLMTNLPPRALVFWLFLQPNPFAAVRPTRQNIIQFCDRERVELLQANNRHFVFMLTLLTGFQYVVIDLAATQNNALNFLGLMQLRIGDYRFISAISEFTKLAHSAFKTK